MTSGKFLLRNPRTLGETSSEIVSIVLSFRNPVNVDIYFTLKSKDPNEEGLLPYDANAIESGRLQGQRFPKVVQLAAW